MESFLETVRSRVSTNVLIMGGAICTVILLVVVWWSRRKEGFQDAAAPATEKIPEMPPRYTQEDCMLFKKTMDAFRLMDISPSKEAGKNEEVQASRSHIEDQYKQLNCDDYLADLASGKIEAPKTDATKRPLPPVGASA
jgi:FtsZ-interacting cell division protein ZipA